MGVLARVILWLGANPKVAMALWITLALGVGALMIDRHAVTRTESKQLIEKIKTNNKVQNEKDRIRSMPRGLAVSIGELRSHKF